MTQNEIQITVLWDVTLCNLVDIYQHFRGAIYLHHQGRGAVFIVTTMRT
jgi:hypothetical protein